MFYFLQELETVIFQEIEILFPNNSDLNPEHFWDNYLIACDISLYRTLAAISIFSDATARSIFSDIYSNKEYIQKPLKPKLNLFDKNPELEKLASETAHRLTVEIPRLLFSNLDLSLEKSILLEKDLSRKIKDLKNKLPILNFENLDLDNEMSVLEFFYGTETDLFLAWIIYTGEEWKEQLKTVMIKYRNIGHDWQFNDEQKKLLKQYYDANLLLVECLNSDCYVSREVRQEIEETLLLPIEEIEKWKQNKQSNDRG